MQRGRWHEKATLGTTLTFFSEIGEIHFTMHSSPDREMQLALTLDGSTHTYIHQFSGHIVNPLFDLEIEQDGEWKTFGTKSMEADFPNEIYTENFVIPEKWTKGKDCLKFRLKARNFHEIPGVIDRLVEKVELFYVNQTEFSAFEAQTADGEHHFLPNAQGLY